MAHRPSPHGAGVHPLLHVAVPNRWVERSHVVHPDPAVGADCNRQKNQIRDVRKSNNWFPGVVLGRHAGPPALSRAACSFRCLADRTAHCRLRCWCWSATASSLSCGNRGIAAPTKHFIVLQVGGDGFNSQALLWIKKNIEKMHFSYWNLRYEQHNKFLEKDPRQWEKIFLRLQVFYFSNSFLLQSSCSIQLFKKSTWKSITQKKLKNQRIQSG